jgi:hypothetical protein
MSSYFTFILASGLGLTLAGAAASCSNSSSSGGGNGGGASGFCPSALPAQGAPCSKAGRACEYGGDAEGACTSYAECVSGAWAVSKPDDTCGQQPASCPATFDAVMQGTTCAADNPVCWYPEGSCGCRACRSDGGITNAGTWNCNAWAGVAAACPTAPRALLGEACSAEGQECDYQHCCSPPALGPYVKCQDGAWIPWDNGECLCAFPACP